MKAWNRYCKPDVILTDINLPCINGFEVLSLLRSDPETARIPVVAISANAMLPDIDKGMKAGFFRYITKPIKVDELMEGLALAMEFSKKLAATTGSGKRGSLDHPS